MELNEYQERAMSTCMPSSKNFSYMFINLVGEMGEFASKIAKQIRKGNMKIGDRDVNDLNYRNASLESVMELRRELGDILWQLSGLSWVLGWSLEQVADENLAKLQARKEAGTIDGSGDGITKEERGGK